VKNFRIHNLVLDSNTIPGWFMGFVMLIFMVMTFLCFEDSTRISHPAVAGTAADTNAAKTEQSALPSRLPFGGLGSCFCATFVTSAVTTSVEVYLIELGKNYWGWSIEPTALFLAGLMLAAGCINMQLGQVAQKLFQSDRAGILFSSVTAIVFCVPLFDFGLEDIAPQLVLVCIGMVVLLTCTSVLRSFSFALATKLVSQEWRPMVSTYSTISLTVGRGVGAIVGSVLTPGSFAPVVMGSYILTAALSATFYWQMQPTTKST